MSLHIDCREATRLALQGQDRRLRWGERLRLRFHLAICNTCPVFVAQLRTMNAALRRWRTGSDGAER